MLDQLVQTLRGFFAETQKSSLFHAAVAVAKASKVAGRSLTLYIPRGETQLLVTNTEGGILLVHVRAHMPYESADEPALMVGGTESDAMLPTARVMLRDIEETFALYPGESLYGRFRADELAVSPAVVSVSPVSLNVTMRRIDDSLNWCK